MGVGEVIANMILAGRGISKKSGARYVAIYFLRS